MSKIGKLLEKMRRNPRDWTIDELKTMADRLGIIYKQPGTSHVTFRAKAGLMLTVPAKKPIKPIYIKRFLELVDLLGESYE